jgi:stage II sporulation protein D
MTRVRSLWRPLGAAAVLTAGALVTVGGPAGAVAPMVALKPTGSLVVTYNGNGHGHGLSQYGAQGAALAGLSTAKILAHYYAGTKLATVKATTLRVLLGGTNGTTSVAPASGLTVTGVKGALPTAGIWRYRLITDTGSTLSLQRLKTGAGNTWTTIHTKLPNDAQFSRPNYAGVRQYSADGSSTVYGGALRAVRVNATGTAGGVHTVAVVWDNEYTAGVTPREMPASWARAATDAQAVAVRTYALYEKAHAGSRYYDICATTACQVYGGQVHYNADGSVAWQQFQQAAKDTLNQVLTYGGQPIFAQFAASDGGWSVSGGQPYLKAAADPYDPGHSGDPYVNAKETVKVASLAAYFDLGSVTGITITQRDGHGAWGGRVLSAVLTGTTKAKKATTLTVDGDDLQWALGLGTTWLTVAAH